ncbi:cyclic lactone autoinducer peptide [Syntrophomonas palmitatica]
MLNKLRLLCLSNLALILISAAHFGIGTRCVVFLYEPDIPASLRS